MRENHHFVLVNEKQIRVSRVSNDTTSFTTHVDQSAKTVFHYVPPADLQPGQYVACIYDDNWWIGYICEISTEEQDALIKFILLELSSHSTGLPDETLVGFQNSS